VLLPDCEAVIWQLPAASRVTAPEGVTEHPLPVAEYVGVSPEVAVAASTGAVPPYVAVTGLPKFWIVCAWPPTAIVTVCGVAAE
jgi:hypothetical protein